eukprot:TRINITY_DN13001_c0_g1_i1.p1 TRINITY_DN13001_c0_g1~~TRINITY_DN13001_c0_g1_i1.p1  ORF type:complete len:123 (+),score=17.96 TRINITY_DN13001_c0_g1_i1:322-690(+)
MKKANLTAVCNGIVFKRKANWNEARIFQEVVNGQLNAWNAFTQEKVLSEFDIKEIMVSNRGASVRTDAEKTLLALCNNLSMQCKINHYDITKVQIKLTNRSIQLSLIHICRCRRYAVCRSRW